MKLLDTPIRSFLIRNPDYEIFSIKYRIDKLQKYVKLLNDFRWIILHKFAYDELDYNDFPNFVGFDGDYRMSHRFLSFYFDESFIKLHHQIILKNKVHKKPTLSKETREKLSRLRKEYNEKYGNPFQYTGDQEHDKRAKEISLMGCRKCRALHPDLLKYTGDAKHDRIVFDIFKNRKVNNAWMFTDKNPFRKTGDPEKDKEYVEQCRLNMIHALKVSREMGEPGISSSTGEELFCKLLHNIGLRFERGSFENQIPSNKKGYYYKPDFFLLDFNTYIEYDGRYKFETVGNKLKLKDEWIERHNWIVSTTKRPVIHINDKDLKEYQLFPERLIDFITKGIQDGPKKL